MEIITDYLHSVKRPIIALVALFFVQGALGLALFLFTDLKEDRVVYAWVVGGINFAFIICWLLVIAWAGLRSIKMTKGVPLDGAIGGAMAAAIAGLFVKVVTFLFNIGMPTVFGEAAVQPTGAAAAAIIGFVKVFVGIAGIIIGLAIDLVVGAIFGALGSLVEEERILAGLPERAKAGKSQKK